MSKITKSAKGENCTARINGVCNHNPETVIWAHIRSNRFGAGMGKKPPDLIGLYACSDCHDAIDRRRYTELDKDWVMQCAYEGHCESLIKLFEKGIVKLG